MLVTAYKRSIPFRVLLLLLLLGCTQRIEYETIITSQLEKKDYLDEIRVHGILEAINTHSFVCPRLREDATIQYLIPEGTHVKSGDTLCILEARETENRYLQAINELEKAKAAYNKSEADLALQYLLLEVQVRNIEASTEISRLDSAQMKFTSPSSREIIKLELEKAEKERNITLKKLEYLKRINDSELQKMKLKIEQQKIQVDQAKSTLDKLSITSSLDGIVLYSDSWTSGEKVREGDIVWGNMPIIQIPELSSMQVKLSVSEAEYKRLAKKQDLDIRIDAYPDLHLTGEIKFKAPVGKPVKKGSNVKMFEVTASLDSTTFTIQPGLGVTCDVQVKSVLDTIVVPLVSLFDEDSSKVVYVAVNQAFERRVVVIADYNNREAVIKKGLAGQETLALIKPPEALILNTLK